MKFALGVILSVGLLYGRLAAIYAPPPPSIPLASSQDAAPPSNREDARLFEQALAIGLLRLGADGRIEVAPADLPLRRRYALDHPDLLTPDAGLPDQWGTIWDDSARQWHRALHFSASGRYVRQQVEAFNTRQPGFTSIQREGERLIWRTAPMRIR